MMNVVRKPGQLWQVSTTKYVLLKECTINDGTLGWEICMFHQTGIFFRRWATSMLMPDTLVVDVER